MAWVSKREKKSGVAFLVEFRMGGRRRSFYLPTRYDEQSARRVADVAERVAVAIDTGTSLDRQTLLWIQSAPDDLKERFERVGLIERTARLTVGELADKYLRAASARLKGTSTRVTEWAFDVFFAFVPEDTAVESITVARACEVFERIRASYSPASYSTVARLVRRLFNWAVELELIEKNPLRAVKGASVKNKSREFFVDRASVARVLAACPSPEWRALFALWRFGGVRRGEAFLITWAGVDFERGRVVVPSPKTERHVGKGARVIPLFPELRYELVALWSSLPASERKDKSARVVQTIGYENVQKKLAAIITAAGVQTWPRLIQNLRASRAIEVFREFGALCESEWIGHGVEVAKNHYLRVLSDEFARAAFPPEPEPTKRSAKRSGKRTKRNKKERN